MLKSFDSYVIALLKLLDGIPRRQGRSKSVIELFAERYDEEIPPVHRRKNASGRLQWIVRVQWSRQKAFNLGFIDAPDRGIWRLTDAGHRWLEEHPSATRVGKAKQVQHRDSTLESSDEGSREGNKWQAFIKSYLETMIPKTVQLPSAQYQIRDDRLYLKIRTIKKCHYEIRAHDDYHEIALHFQSSKPARNQALLRAFEPHLDSLARKIQGEIRDSDVPTSLSVTNEELPLHAERWGPDGAWARLWIKLPEPTRLESSILFEPLVALKLVEATWDIFQSAYASVCQGIVNVPNEEKTNGYYVILDREIAAIRAFLQGRSDHRPSDEKLCDWVQFCYLFELPIEGRDLFALVNPGEVDPWYLERTKKIARICALKANSNA